MENIDVTVLRTLRNWRLESKRALLVTVVRTWGSSPRPVGSIMALSEDGAVVGSVSGGCIEDDLISQYRKAYAGDDSELQVSRGIPQFVKYGITADEAHQFGLPCGGTLELLIEYDPEVNALDELVRTLEAGNLMKRVVCLTNGRVTLSIASTPCELSIGSELVNVFGPPYRMLLIGAGQLTEYLATMALFNGFSVTVCDPREEYLGTWGLTGVQLIRGMPDDVLASFKADRRSCVIALTHDPKLDDLALLEALSTDAFYIGAIGSRRNNELRRIRMMEYFGKSEHDLQRLRGPIGIYVGSKTPPEIAVSIMAEVLAIKNDVTLSPEVNVAQAKHLRDIKINVSDATH
ncbi:XdhC family protein [Noviherbaspirillum sp. CPCC 100848]|uniref:XdhC family protein n=1 Tax=Noviherbaspirillum album TaxID=3080276 RepID=A0ABU6JI13_9BURK|nr:XdhC family protein [Noviherbaspirillum sp. CPCC 100848]MEC4722832.1 XdhC family protein [Noviherbaspirillum sp. CPCC 100848]